MKLKVFAVAIFFTLTVIACGGGGGGAAGGVAGGADFVSISVDSAAPVTYTEAQSTISPMHYDPYIWSSVSGTTAAYLYIHDFQGTTSDVPRLEIGIKGTIPGTYTIAAGSTLYYMPSGTTYVCSSFSPSSSGTITVTEFGAPGGPIKGTFDVIATNSAHLTGSFSITRY